MQAKCLECGAPSTHRHHVIPQSRGGRATVPLCDECHAIAHRTDLGTLRADAARRLAESGRASGGVAPYGWRVEYGRLIADEEEQRAINAILGMRLENLTYTQICARLAANGYKPRGNAWSAQIVRKIVIRYLSHAGE
jgi:hypothetical protein